MGLGSGKPHTIRHFVESIHSLTGSGTLLKFGAVPYRDNEIMESRSDISFLKKLGWEPRVTLEEGIRKMIEGEKK